MNERLSAFLDGEASRDDIEAVLAELLRDETARDSWSRQNWIRTTLRAAETEKPIALELGFSNRVMQAIESEDQQDTVVPMTTPAVTAPAAPTRSRRRLGSRAWQGMAGMGMAAAVAGVVFVSASPFGQTGRGTSAGTVATTNPSSARTSRNTATSNADTATTRTARAGFDSARWNDQLVDFDTVRAPTSASVHRVAARASTSASDRWSVNDPAVREELNGYLVDHNGMARGYGMSSTTPAYVRVATYGQGATQ